MLTMIVMVAEIENGLLRLDSTQWPKTQNKRSEIQSRVFQAKSKTYSLTAQSSYSAPNFKIIIIEIDGTMVKRPTYLQRDPSLLLSCPLAFFIQGCVVLTSPEPLVVFSPRLVSVGFPIFPEIVIDMTVRRGIV